MTSLRRIAALLESFEPMAHVEPEPLADPERTDAGATDEPTAPTTESSRE